VRALFQTEQDGSRKQLTLRLVFEYGLKDHPNHSLDKFFVDVENKKIIEKDFGFEERCLKKIISLDVTGPYGFRGRPSTFNIPQTNL